MPSRTAARKRVLLKQAQCSVLHQPLGIGACLGGDLRKLRFLLGSEMYFHRLQNTGKPGLKQYL